MNRKLVSVLLALGALGCAPTVEVSRLVPPEVSLGTVRALSVQMKTNVGDAVASALANGLVSGELPLPLDAKEALKTRLTERLAQFGATVCGAPPCGDAALTVTFRETQMAVAGTDNGWPIMRVRLEVRYLIVRNDGVKLMDMSAWERRQARAENAESALNNALDRLANSFSSSFLPRRQTAAIPIDDGGELQPGVDALLSGHPDIAYDLFSKLVAAQPNNAGAHYDLGVVYEVRGEWGRAAPYYRRAMELSDRARYRFALEEAERQAARAARPVP
jgi:tetratricopeptide (TPR) repeat protein